MPNVLYTMKVKGKEYSLGTMFRNIDEYYNCMGVLVSSGARTLEKKLNWKIRKEDTRKHIGH